jgi:hypothetical protein
MSLPTSEPIPDDDTALPPARRRRSQRLIAPQGADERASFIDEVAHRITPSLDFFLFAFFCGAVTGGAVMLNSPALFLLAALIAPYMGPLIGLSFATVIGSGRFFLRMFSALLVAIILVFAAGALAGYASKMLPNLKVDEAGRLAHLNWPGGMVLIIGALLVTILTVRSDQRPYLPGVILAYLVLLPVGIAGFGVGSSMSFLWQEALVTFVVHLTGAALVGMVTLVFMGFRPLTLFGYTLGTTLTLLAIIIALGLSGIGGLINQINPPVPPTMTQDKPLTTETPVPSPTGHPSQTPIPFTVTPTPTRTLKPTPTPTVTITPAPTPLWALIDSETGANIRAEPDPQAAIVARLLGGTLIQILPETATQNGNVWVHVRTADGITGWVLQILLKTATPAPNW